MSGLSNVKVVSGGHGGNTRVLVDGKEIAGVLGLTFNLESAAHIGELTLVIEGAELEVEALRVKIDGADAL